MLLHRCSSGARASYSDRGKCIWSCRCVALTPNSLRKQTKVCDQARTWGEWPLPRSQWLEGERSVALATTFQQPPGQRIAYMSFLVAFTAPEAIYPPLAHLSLASSSRSRACAASRCVARLFTVNLTAGRPVRLFLIVRWAYQMLPLRLTPCRACSSGCAAAAAAAAAAMALGANRSVTPALLPRCLRSLASTDRASLRSAAASGGSQAGDKAKDTPRASRWVYWEALQRREVRQRRIEARYGCRERRTGRESALGEDGLATRQRTAGGGAGYGKWHTAAPTEFNSSIRVCCHDGLLPQLTAGCSHHGCCGAPAAGGNGEVAPGGRVPAVGNAANDGCTIPLIVHCSICDIGWRCPSGTADRERRHGRLVGQLGGGATVATPLRALGCSVARRTAVHALAARLTCSVPADSPKGAPLRHSQLRKAPWRQRRLLSLMPCGTASGRIEHAAGGALRLQAVCSSPPPLPPDSRRTPATFSPPAPSIPTVLTAVTQA